jgi:hypothetical protein
MDQEPDFRAPRHNPDSPPHAERPNVHYRSLRASVAATAVHEKLKAKLNADSVDSPARHRETESDREAMQALVARAAETTPEGYPLQLLRRLRRTIPVSVPVPEAIRSMLDKRGRS